MNRVVVTSIGMLTQSAQSPAELWAQLDRGDVIKQQPCWSESDHHAVIEPLEPTKDLDGKHFRPYHRPALLAMIAVQRAITNMKLESDPDQLPNHDLGLVLGSMFTSMQTILAFDAHALEAGPRYARPLDFANTVLNAAGGQTAIWHGLTGPNTTVSSGLTSGLTALEEACRSIRLGRNKALFAGGVDALCADTALAFSSAGHLDKTTQPYKPMLGEGAAVLLLEARETALARGATIHAECLGTATGFDPSRGADPVRAQTHVGNTVDRAIRRAGIEPHQLATIASSRSGHPRLDPLEASVLEKRFSGVPRFALKPFIGETMGPSAVLQSIALIHSLNQRKVPGQASLWGRFNDLDTDAGMNGAPSVIASGPGLVVSLGLSGECAALVIAPP